MRWEDLVLAVAGFMFSVALVPALRGEEKPPLTSSLTTAGLLGCVGVAYAFLGLWLGLISTGLNCVAWAVLAIQRLRNRRCRTS
jgi:CHASE2 domain-containing sensor protein